MLDGIVPFSPEQLVYADNLFQLRLYKADGQAYENLFAEVMTLRYPDFRPVKPQGKLGDRKNDGYSSQRGVYHQVYAPENAETTIAKGMAKLGEDFAGLLVYWNKLCPIREYYFVVNDKFKGTYPTVEAKLLELKTQHNLVECRPFLNADLMRVFKELNDRDIMKILGHIPSPDIIADLDYSLFTDVLRHVVDNHTPITVDAVLTVPDFNEKIAFNGISPAVAALLTTGNFQSGAVERFFNSHGTFSKAAIRDKLAAIYTSLKCENGKPNNSKMCPSDLVFFGLLEAITPEPSKAHWQSPAIVLLSYFFESCDIYEDPKLLI